VRLGGPALPLRQSPRCAEAQCTEVSISISVVVISL